VGRQFECVNACVHLSTMKLLGGSKLDKVSEDPEIESCGHTGDTNGPSRTVPNNTGHDPDNLSVVQYYTVFENSPPWEGRHHMLHLRPDIRREPEPVGCYIVPIVEHSASLIDQRHCAGLPDYWLYLQPERFRPLFERVLFRINTLAFPYLLLLFASSFCFSMSRCNILEVPLKQSLSR